MAQHVGVPLVDLTAWFSGDPQQRARLASEVDQHLQRVGFLVVTGHGITEELRARVRAEGQAFFDQPKAVKEAYRSQVGGRGWLSIGAEANAYSEGTPSPPDLKESFIMGAEGPERQGPDAAWFVPNVWPSEVGQLQQTVEEYVAAMRSLADDLLELFSLALGQPSTYFGEVTGSASWSFQLNWYPNMGFTGKPLPGQYRIGPHTDFGTVTILDRQPGSGGLQIDIDGEGWVDAPYLPGSLVINTGDLLARWTGERWQSNRHRVLPPQEAAPDEALMSLVYFFEADPEATLTPLAPPAGRVAGLAPVRAGDFVRERYDAIKLT